MGLGKFVLTLGLGAVAGLLLAPKAGNELRGELLDKGKDALDNVSNMSKEDYQNLINNTIDEVKKMIDEFDVEAFKESTKDKLIELMRRLEDILEKIKASEQYAKASEAVAQVLSRVNEKVNEVKQKMSEHEYDDFSELEDDIEAIEKDLDEILDDQEK